MWLVLWLALVGQAEAGKFVMCEYTIIRFESEEKLREEEAKRAATELREPRPVPTNGAVLVQTGAENATASAAENFVIAFGDATKPDGLERRQQSTGTDTLQITYVGTERTVPRATPTLVPTAMGAGWEIWFREPVPSLPVEVHVINSHMSRRCSATIDEKGRLKKLK